MRSSQLVAYKKLASRHTKKRLGDLGGIKRSGRLESRSARETPGMGPSSPTRAA